MVFPAPRGAAWCKLWEREEGVRRGPSYKPGSWLSQKQIPSDLPSFVISAFRAGFSAGVSSANSGQSIWVCASWGGVRNPGCSREQGPCWMGLGPADSYLEAGAFPLTFERRPWKLIVYLVSLAFNCCLITWFPFLISLLMCSVWWEKKDSLWTAEEIPWETHHPLQRPPGIPLLSEVHKRRGSQKGN